MCVPCRGGWFSGEFGDAAVFEPQHLHVTTSGPVSTQRLRMYVLSEGRHMNTCTQPLCHVAPLTSGLSTSKTVVCGGKARRKARPSRPAPRLTT